MPTSITLTGFKEFEAKLKAMSAILKSEIDGETEAAGKFWATRAKQDAPVDIGFLKGQITSRKVRDMESEVTSAANYSAYLEWGTKTRVQVPADLQPYAEQFRGGRPGAGNAKKMIYAWMERVGIPKEFQWIVFFSIIIKGIHPHPYFFIQRPIVQALLDKNVTTILNTEH